MCAGRTEVEAVKLAVSNLVVGDADCKRIVEHSICTLLELYEAQAKEEYLKKALVHMTAYLELGFPYEDMQKIFDTVLLKLNLKREEVFKRNCYAMKRIPLKKCHVKSLLGRWNPKFHSHKIGDAVNDIMSKAAAKKAGTYLYHSGKVILETEEQTIWEKTFYLHVTENGSIVYDVSRNRYYTFDI